MLRAVGSERIPGYLGRFELSRFSTLAAVVIARLFIRTCHVPKWDHAGLNLS
jgi:hypothetical protein